MHRAKQVNIALVRVALAISDSSKTRLTMIRQH